MHCGVEQKKITAYLLSEILGHENIYKLPKGLEDITKLEDIPVLPSPEKLKYKYIIKCKAKRVIPKFMIEQGLQIDSLTIPETVSKPSEIESRPLKQMKVMVKKV